MRAAGIMRYLARQVDGLRALAAALAAPTGAAPRTQPAVLADRGGLHAPRDEHPSHIYPSDGVRTGRAAAASL